MKKLLLSAILAAAVALSGAANLDVRAAGSLPETYDLRNVGGTSYVTPTRNQGRYGNCWAFAAMASLESAILKQNVDDRVTAATLDLSEDHMDRHHGYDYTPRISGGRYELAVSYLACVP